MGPVGVAMECGFFFPCFFLLWFLRSQTWGHMYLGQQLHWGGPPGCGVCTNECIASIAGHIAMLVMRGLGRSEHRQICATPPSEPAGNSPCKTQKSEIQFTGNAIYHLASLIWSRYGWDVHPTCSGCGLGSGSGLLYIAVRAWQRGNYRKWVGWGHQEFKWHNNS